MLEQKNVQVKAGSSFQTICPFPVGYIYQSYTNTSPATIYGGTWTPITGRFLYCNNSTATGGSNTHSHNQGNLVACIGAVDGHTDYIAYRTADRVAGAPYNIGVVGQAGTAGTWNDVNHSTRVDGTTGSSSNMPAYQSCYTWRRTA